MNKYVLGIDGMRCGMCEMHVEQTLERSPKTKKVRASHLKNEAIVFSESDMDQEAFESLLKPTGYRLTSYRKEEAKKTLFGWR